MQVKHIFHFGPAVLLILTVALACINPGRGSAAYCLAVLSGCLTYHLAAWILSAVAVVGIMNNRADDSRFWFREFAWEKRWYQRIGLRKWKRYLPSYTPDFYDFRTVPHADLLARISQTEVVHEVAAAMSLLSIGGACIFGCWPIFAGIAAADCLINIVYASLQRYNRMRLRKLIDRSSAIHD